MGSKCCEFTCGIRALKREGRIPNAINILCLHVQMLWQRNEKNKDSFSRTRGISAITNRVSSMIRGSTDKESIT